MRAVQSVSSEVYTILTKALNYGPVRVTIIPYCTYTYSTGTTNNTVSLSATGNSGEVIAGNATSTYCSMAIATSRVMNNEVS